MMQISYNVPMKKMLSLKQSLKYYRYSREEETIPLRDLLHSRIGDLVKPVSSGHGSIDLIVPDFHKATDIQLLQEKWRVKDDETMAFGDGGNDIEMLKACKVWVCYGKWQ